MSLSLSLSLLAFIFSLAGAATSARAEDKTAARDHWERGTKFYDLGKYDDAIREFESAYEAKSDPAFLYNLAQSHRLAGHPNDSLRFYRTYLRYVPKPANRADIEDRIKELERIVADHPTDAPAPPPNAPAGPAALPPPATGSTPTGPAPATPQGTWPPTNVPGTGPGPGAPGAPPAATGPESQTVPSGAPAGTSPDPSAPTVRQGSGRRTAGIALGAAGGGLVVVGAIFGLVAKNQSKKVETAADNRQAFDPSVQSLGKTSQALQWVGYIAGVAALATGVILYATSPPGAGTETAPPRVAMAPVVGPGTGGAVLRLAF